MSYWRETAHQNYAKESQTNSDEAQKRVQRSDISRTTANGQPGARTHRRTYARTDAYARTHAGTHTHARTHGRTGLRGVDPVEKERRDDGAEEGAPHGLVREVGRDLLQREEHPANGRAERRGHARRACRRAPAPAPAAAEAAAAGAAAAHTQRSAANRRQGEEGKEMRGRANKERDAPRGHECKEAGEAGTQANEARNRTERARQQKAKRKAGGRMTMTEHAVPAAERISFFLYWLR